jgi:hypothetical protein
MALRVSHNNEPADEEVIIKRVEESDHTILPQVIDGKKYAVIVYCLSNDLGGVVYTIKVNEDSTDESINAGWQQRYVIAEAFVNDAEPYEIDAEDYEGNKTTITVRDVGRYASAGIIKGEL